MIVLCKDRHHTYHMYTSLYIQTGQGALCSAEERGIVQLRGQGALYSTENREHCKVQGTRNIVHRTGSIVKHEGEKFAQCRGQASHLLRAHNTLHTNTGEGALCSIEGRLANYARVQSLQVQVNSVYVAVLQLCVVQETGSIA